MINITGLREDKRPQSSTIVHALLDRLEAAEKDAALKERVIDALGSELNAVANEGDTMRTKISDLTINAEYLGNLKKSYEELIGELQDDRDALRAKIAAASEAKP